VDGIADLLVLAAKPFKKDLDRFPILTQCSIPDLLASFSPFDGSEKNLFLFAEMCCHIGCDLAKDGGNFHNLGMMSAVNRGDFPGIGIDRLKVIFEICMMRIDDVVGKK